jgi:hypothetical protein
MLQWHVSSVKKSKDEELAAVPDVVQTAKLNAVCHASRRLCPDLMIAGLTQDSVNQFLPD